MPRRPCTSGRKPRRGGAAGLVLEEAAGAAGLCGDIALDGNETITALSRCRHVPVRQIRWQECAPRGSAMGGIGQSVHNAQNGRKGNYAEAFQGFMES